MRYRENIFIYYKKNDDVINQFTGEFYEYKADIPLFNQNIVVGVRK